MGNTQAFHFDSRCESLPTTIKPGQAEFSLKQGQQRRTGLIYFPTSIKLDNTRPRPVVFCYHGAAGHAEHFSEYTQMTALADFEDFIVVFPNGTGRNSLQKCYLDWNSGVNPDGRLQRKGVDDVAFFLKMMDCFEKHLPIDTTRVYAAGFSNGGAMCHRLATHPVASTRLAAIASVAGTVHIQGEVFKPCRPMPVLHVHSVDDPVVLYNGGTAKKNCVIRKPNDHPAALSLLSQWVRFNNRLSPDQELAPSASRAPRREAVLEKTKHTAEHTFWASPDGTADVELITLSGAGHQWPSAASSRLPCWLEPYVGSPTTIIDANTSIWQFFQRFSLAGEGAWNQELALPVKGGQVEHSLIDAPPAYDELGRK